jgi:hypothetical protein
MAYQPIDEDSEPAEGVVIPIRIAPWLRAEFLDIAGVRMKNPNAVAMLTVVIDGSTNPETVFLAMSYRYLTDDTETEDCA